jgi:hypothetical protein
MFCHSRAALLVVARPSTDCGLIHSIVNPELTSFCRLYWYPTDAEFATSNGWPSGWQTPGTYLEKLKARLPSTDTPSTDGKRYMTQVYDIVKSLLDKQNYSGITINNNPSAKDHVYGNPAYYVSNILTPNNAFRAKSLGAPHQTQGGKRTGPMDTYLKTAKARSNFKLMTYTKVLSVVRSGAKITGVQTNDTSSGYKSTLLNQCLYAVCFSWRQWYHSSYHQWSCYLVCGCFWNRKDTLPVWYWPFRHDFHRRCRFDRFEVFAPVFAIH